MSCSGTCSTLNMPITPHFSLYCSGSMDMSAFVCPWIFVCQVLQRGWHKTCERLIQGPRGGPAATCYRFLDNIHAAGQRHRTPSTRSTRNNEFAPTTTQRFLVCDRKRPQLAQSHATWTLSPGRCRNPPSPVVHSWLSRYRQSKKKIGKKLCLSTNRICCR